MTTCWWLSCCLGPAYSRKITWSCNAGQVQTLKSIPGNIQPQASGLCTESTAWNFMVCVIQEVERDYHNVPFKPWHLRALAYKPPWKAILDDCFKLDSEQSLNSTSAESSIVKIMVLQAFHPPRKNSVCFASPALLHTLSRRPLSSPHRSLQTIPQTQQSWRSNSLPYSLKVPISKIVLLKWKPQLWCHWDNLEGAGIPQPWRYFPQQIHPG